MIATPKGNLKKKKENVGVVAEHATRAPALSAL